MVLGLEQKKAIVADVSQVAENAVSAVAADYRGLTVGQMTALRADARKQGVYLRVVRNTLAKRAVKGTSFECLDEALVGPIVLAFGQEDPGAPARLIKDFAKDNKELEVKVLSIGGKLLGPGDIDVLAKLPNREEALALLMSVMKAPITKFVRTMAEPAGMVVRAMGAVRDQKKSKGE